MDLPKLYLQIFKFSMFTIYYEKEDKVNDLQSYFCPQHGDLNGSMWRDLGPGSVGVTQACEAESVMRNLKADRC